MSARMGEGLEIRSAEPRDARAFLEHWTAIVAEERFVRSEEVQTSVRAYRRRFRQRSELGTDLLAFEARRLVGHVTVQRERHPVTRHVGSLAIAVAVLSVYPHNEAAISLYRSFGFVEEGRLARHSRKSYGYEDEILMAAWIGSDG
jgi:L-amino acid N-acyltransferase YncA